MRCWPKFGVVRPYPYPFYIQGSEAARTITLSLSCLHSYRSDKLSRFLEVERFVFARSNGLVHDASNFDPGCIHGEEIVKKGFFAKKRLTIALSNVVACPCSVRPHLHLISSTHAPSQVQTLTTFTTTLLLPSSEGTQSWIQSNIHCLSGGTHAPVHRNAGVLR